MSYRNDLSFGVTGDWDTTPELHMLTDGIRISVNELLES
jgi:diacylglycerol O-acyltransferase